MPDLVVLFHKSGHLRTVNELNRRQALILRYTASIKVRTGSKDPCSLALESCQVLSRLCRMRHAAIADGETRAVLCNQVVDCIPT